MAGSKIHPAAQLGFQRLSKACLCLVFLIGASVLSGWILDISILKSLLPGFVPMKINAAVCLLMVGLATVLASPSSGEPRTRQAIGRALAALSIAFSGTILLETIFDWNAGIDQIFFFDKEPCLNWQAPPGRLAPPTSFTLLLLSISALLLTYRQQWGEWGAQAVAAIATLLPFFVMLNYFIGQKGVIDTGRFHFFPNMSMPIAFAMTALAVAILAARPDRGFMRVASTDSFAGESIRRILLPMLGALPLVAGIVGAGVGSLYAGTVALSLLTLVWIVLSTVLIWVHASRLTAAEGALRASEINLRTITDAIPQMVCSALPNGRTDYANKRWYEFTGMPEGTAAAADWRSLIHPEDLARTHEVWQRALGEEAGFEVEFRFRHHSSEYRWILAQAVPLLDDKGKLTRWLSTHTDIHEHKRATEELETFWALPNHLLAIGRLSEQFAAELSPAWERTLGYSLDELKSTPWIKFVHEDDQALVLPFFRESLTAKRKSFDYRMVTKDGETKWLTWTIHPVGESIYGTARDITDLKNAEHALVSAKALAESANHAKSQFLANMSHEIRTPLGIILGTLDLMRDIRQDQTEFERLNRMATRNAQQLGKIIDEVLDLSKVEAGALLVEKTRFNLLELLEDIINGFTMMAKEKGICLTLRSEGSIPRTIDSDPIRLRQILNNVIGNAVKFTDEGLVDVTLRCLAATSEDATARLEILIADTGIGLSTEQRKRIFQPFSQADNSVTRRYGGTGLGLVLSRELARALGGELELVNEPEHTGCKFRLLLSHGGEATPERCSEEAFVTPSSPDSFENPKATLHGLKVLLVDDSPDNRFMVSRFLRGAGAEVETAEDGAQGVEKASQGLYSVILMDVQMPIMDGETATRHLREKGYNGTIIALTAHAMRGDRERAIKVGFDDYLTKPVDRNQLIRCLADLGTLRADASAG